MAPRAVDAARGLGTQRLRAGLTSVAPTALGLGPETNQRRPTLQKAKDEAPESSRGRGVRTEHPRGGLRSIQEVGILESGGLVIASIFSIEIECRPPRSKSLPLTFTYLPAYGNI
jgi:hypothetical protein